MDATILNLCSVLEHHAALDPERLALVFREHRLSYGQVNAMASRVAGGLRTMGIRPGDHVALSCPNLPYFPIAFFGILKAGAVAVPLNILFKPTEIAYHLQDCDARALLCFEGTSELPMARMAVAALATMAEPPPLIVITADPAGRTDVAGARSLAELMAGQPADFETHPAHPDDTAVMLYTSGTTGQPKGAELTHANMAIHAMVTSRLYAPALAPIADRQPVFLITLPLFHSTGLSAQMISHFHDAGVVVLLPRFEPAAVISTMIAEKVNFWVGVPTMYWTLLQHSAAGGVDVGAVAEHLRLCASGGAPMPVAVMQQFERTFGVRVIEGYGLSETSPVATFNHLQRPSKAGTVGQPILGVEVRVVGEDDRPRPAGERGEVVIRGHNVMKGYYKRPRETAEAMRGGWFHTGDIGVFDDEGYLSIVDRKKELILRAGLNVYPREVEEVMMTHPAVSLVAVIGTPDERLGEEVKAYVVRKADAAITEDEIVAWCRERMAAYKYPRTVEFRDSLPMTATGKILKRALQS
jgi:long-chain acyl-CoA synthetase